MVETKELKSGDVLSEASHYKVVKFRGDDVVMLLDGEEVSLHKSYVEKFLFSADQYDTEETMSRTDVVEKLKEHPRMACSVYYRKTDAEKGVRAFNREKNEKIEGVTTLVETIANSSISDIPSLLKKVKAKTTELVENPITRIIPGEMRLMRGYHENKLDNHGRLKFMDVEGGGIEKKVDFRTTQYVIVDRVKYVVK